MGTRADFYVGRGREAEWLGSIAWDGHEVGRIREATSEGNFRTFVAAFLAERDDATLPEAGWPWPWNDSGTTDCVYAWDGPMGSHSVWTVQGYPEQEWVSYAASEAWQESTRGKEPDEWSDGPTADGGQCVFPDMSARKNVRRDRGSGLIVIS